MGDLSEKAVLPVSETVTFGDGAESRVRVEAAMNSAFAMALEIAATAAQAYLRSQGYKGEKTAAAIRALTIPLPRQADPGETIDKFARRLIDVANGAGIPVAGIHNAFTVCAWPGATITDVLASWNANQRASYMGADR